jgi:hypothetical protein
MLTKDDLEIIDELGWRSGFCTVYTTDGKPPEFICTKRLGSDGSKNSVDVLSPCDNNIKRY